MAIESRSIVPPAEQDGLFDLVYEPTEAFMPVDDETPLLKRRSFRTDDVDRVSEAQAELGGGPPRETLAADPPGHRRPSHGRPGNGRGYHETDGRMSTLDHDKYDPVPEPAVSVAESSAARSYEAVRAALRLAEQHRRAAGDPTIAVALSVASRKKAG